jgi:hypothetical protein
MLSKYSFVLLPVAVALYLARRPQRAWWKRQEPYLAAAIAAAMIAPVLLWNARHGWASFEFQAVTRHLRAWPPWATVPRYFLAQQAISPPLWIACAAAFLHSGSLARRGDDAHAYLWYVSATVLGFFCLASLHAWVNPNWCGIGFLPLVLAAGDLLSTRSRALRLAPIALAAPLTVAFHLQAATLVFPLPPRMDFATDLHGWDEVGRRVRAMTAPAAEPAGAFVFSRRWQFSGLAAFYAGDAVEVTRLGGRRDAYDDWRDDTRLRGRTGILLYDDQYVAIPSEYPFRSCEPAGELPIIRNGRTLRTFTFWRCPGYAP